MTSGGDVKILCISGTSSSRFVKSPLWSEIETEQTGLNQFYFGCKKPLLVLPCGFSYMKPKVFALFLPRGGMGSRWYIWVLLCTAVSAARHHDEALNDIFKAELGVLDTNRQLFYGIGSSGSEG